MTDPMLDTTKLELFRDGDAQTALDAATRSVRDHCGWHVGPSLSEVVTVRGRGADSVWLPSLFVTAVASVTVDGDELPVGDYEWTVEGRLTRILGWFNYGALIEVDLTHGHTPVPEAVVEVVAARALRRMSNPGGDVQAVAKGPFSTQYRGGVTGFKPEDEIDALRPYRIPRSR